MEKNKQRSYVPFYSSMPLAVFQRIASTFSEGLEKYDPSLWERMYQKDYTPEDFLKMFDHAIEHIYKGIDEVVNGKIHDGAEDQLAHAVVNLIMIMWGTENGRLPNKLKDFPNAMSLNTLDEILEDDEDEIVEEVLEEVPQENVVTKFLNSLKKTKDNR
jgi:hypothetical protein